DIFEKQAMFIHDSRNAVLLGIQQGQEKGLKQGLQQGLKQGQEKGLKQGIEQGEKKANLKIARTLIGKLPTNEISQITGLTAEEIEKLSTQ
ncbi:MAG: transposase, partial [Cyanobacteria bacterium J06598_3]